MIICIGMQVSCILTRVMKNENYYLQELYVQIVMMRLPNLVASLLMDLYIIYY
jgi:hypothetical protein